MKLKKRIITTCGIGLLVLIASCSQSSKSERKDNGTNNENNEQSVVQQNEETNLDFLKKYDGKYADEVHLFEKKIFSERLEKLIGTENFKLIKDDWTTLMPMEYAKSIFSAEGCKPHDCGPNNYIIVYDFSLDAMYAGISKNENVKTFSETGEESAVVLKWAPM